MQLQSNLCQFSRGDCNICPDKKMLDAHIYRKEKKWVLQLCRQTYNCRLSFIDYMCRSENASANFVPHFKELGFKNAYILAKYVYRKWGKIRTNWLRCTKNNSYSSTKSDADCKGIWKEINVIFNPAVRTTRKYNKTLKSRSNTRLKQTYSELSIQPQLLRYYL